MMENFRIELLRLKHLYLDKAKSGMGYLTATGLMYIHVHVQWNVFCLQYPKW